MSDESSQSYKISPSEAAKMCKIILTPSRNTRRLYDLIRWWNRNQNKIHTDPVIRKKCDRMLFQLKNYHEYLKNRIKRLKQLINCGNEVYKKHGPESNEFKKIEKTCGEAQRALIAAETDAGHYIQALITKWFYESNCFTIIDIEVKGTNYDFDLEVVDESNNKYDVEIWQSKSKYSHALNETAEIKGVYQGKVHTCRGTIPSRLSDVAPTRTYIKADYNFDLPKIVKKINQLRNDHVGFLIAYRGGFDPLFVDPENIPRNKCILVLCHIRDWEFGKRGFGYAVHHPNFEQIDAAINIIRSLKFTFEQDWHDIGLKSTLKNPSRVRSIDNIQRSLLHLQIQAGLEN